MKKRNGVLVQPLDSGYFAAGFFRINPHPLRISGEPQNLAEPRPIQNRNGLPDRPRGRSLRIQSIMIVVLLLKKVIVRSCARKSDYSSCGDPLSSPD